ncbi:Uncharacterized membrane protein YebE, DUF533 family [Rhodovulum sp. ES.010]|uniref:DUF533 domain-containing protein n=1 Tax=Rhodovulum sp. ES.010 TaxID=1882821 RepID=UPI000925FCD3|nr:DUF533 domain-containing protein [Rhodovulum sp. ES.010]SIO56598.1 Uncharacterized membrane protein YebE, DUF533 family [Rhodovulum sp. ES.010]
MSFVRTLATLAAGFAAAKGVDQYRKMGGMAGLQEKLRSNEQLGQMTAQVGEMMERMGVKDGQARLEETLKRMGEGSRKAGETATAGFGSLMTAISGAAAAGTHQATQMLDAITGTTAATATTEENAKLMIRAMIQAAKADGEIDAEERARIFDHLGDVSDAERAFVEAQMDAPVDPVGLAEDTSEAMRAQVYAAAATTVRLDNPAETAFLQNLATALGLEAETVARIRSGMGLSP